MRKFIMAALFFAYVLCPSLADTPLAADVTRPPALDPDRIPPRGPSNLKTNGPEATAIPRAPQGLRVDGVDGVRLPDCPSSKMVELPLNWNPVDPDILEGWITPRKQEGSLLCWAATTEMAVNFYGTILPQCQQVNDAFFPSTNTCCPNPDIVNGCDRTDNSLPQFARYGFHVTQRLITNWSEIKTYICEKHSPFLYFFVPNEREHILLVHGYDTSVNHVFVVDPLDPDFGPSLFVSDFDYMFKGGENHTRDYVDICPEARAATNGGSCPKIRE